MVQTTESIEQSKNEGEWKENWEREQSEEVRNNALKMRENESSQEEKKVEEKW